MDGWMDVEGWWMVRWIDECIRNGWVDEYMGGQIYVCRYVWVDKCRGG